MKKWRWIPLVLVLLLPSGSVLAQTISPTSTSTVTNAFAWQRTDRYIPPNFESFFPDDPAGARRLAELWKRPKP